VDAHLGMQVTDPEEMEVETETELDSPHGEVGDAGVRIHSPLAVVEHGAIWVRKCVGRGGEYPACLPRLCVRKPRIQPGCPLHGPYAMVPIYYVHCLFRFLLPIFVLNLSFSSLN
jgi:hypothetical protein